MTLLTQIFETTATMSAVIALLLVLMKATGKRFTAKCRYILWLLVILRLCMPVGLTGVSPIFELSLPERSAVSETTAETEKLTSNVSPETYTQQTIPDTPAATPISPTVPTSPTAPTTPVTPDVPTIPEPPSVSVTEAPADMGVKLDFYDVPTIVGIVYAVGAAAFLTLRLAGYGIFMARIKRLGALRAPTDKVAKVYSEIASSMGLKNPPRLQVTSIKISPFLCGYLRHSIIIPETVEDGDDLRHVLTHELTHYRRGDVYIKLLCTLAQAIHWFNPFAHVAAKKMNAEIEFACDEAVLRGTDEGTRLTYGTTMLELAKECQSVRGAGLTSHFNPTKSALRERIERIIDMKNKNKGIILIIVVVVACALAGSIIAFTLPGDGKDSDVDITETAENTDTEAPETTQPPETVPPETEPPETEPPEPVPTLNRNFLDDIGSTYPRLTEKYGSPVRVQYPAGGYGIYFEANENIIFEWNPDVAGVRIPLTDTEYDENGNMIIPAPKDDAPVYSISGMSLSDIVLNIGETVSLEELKALPGWSYVYSHNDTYDENIHIANFVYDEAKTVRIRYSDENEISCNAFCSANHRRSAQPSESAAPDCDMNTALLEEISCDFAAINAKYGKVIAVSYPGHKAGYVFESLPNITFMWDAISAGVDRFNMVFDEAGNYVGDTPESGVACAAISGNIGELFPDCDGITPEEVMCFDKIADYFDIRHTASQYPGGAGEYTSRSSYDLSNLYIYHESPTVYSPDDLWTYDNRYSSINIYKNAVTEETYFSGRYPERDEEARLAWYEGFDQTVTKSDGSTYIKKGINPEVVALTEALIMNDVGTLEELSFANPGDMISYEGMVISDYKLRLSDNNHGNGVYSLEVDILVESSSNEVLTTGVHTVTFGTGPDTMMIVDGRHGSSWWQLDKTTIESRVFNLAEYFVVKGIFSMEDFNRLAMEEENGGLVYLLIMLSSTYDENLPHNTANGVEYRPGWTHDDPLTVDHIKSYAKAYLGIEDFTPIDTYYFYTIENGVIVGKNTFPWASPYTFNDYFIEEDGTIGIRLYCYADAGLTVRAKTVLYKFKMTDGVLVPTEIILEEDFGFKANCHSSGV